MLTALLHALTAALHSLAITTNQIPGMNTEDTTETNTIIALKGAVSGYSLQAYSSL
jgi:hypothetical protein